MSVPSISVSLDCRASIRGDSAVAERTPGVLSSPTSPRGTRREERCYVGRRPDATEVYVVCSAGAEPLAHLGYRSAASFDWGCTGAGSLELAFALLSHATARRPTDPVCQAFCEQVVGALDRTGFVLSDGDVALWLMSAFSALEGPHEDDPSEGASSRWRALGWLRSHLRRA